MTVTFSARGAPPSAPYSSAATYRWNFGDGAITNGSYGRHTYSRPGTYRATVEYTRFINVIDAERIELATQSLIVTVTTPAALMVAPEVLTFAGVVGGVTTQSEAVAIINGGGSLLRWSVSTDRGDWLRLSTSRGSLAAGQRAELRVLASDSTLTAGTYSALLRFTSPDATNSPVTAAVRFVLTAKSTPRVPMGLLAALGIAACAAGVIAWHYKFKRPRVEVRTVLDPGTQQIGVQGALLGLFVNVRINPGVGTTSVKAAGPILGKIVRNRRPSL